MLVSQLPISAHFDEVVRIGNELFDKNFPLDELNPLADLLKQAEPSEAYEAMQALVTERLCAYLLEDSKIGAMKRSDGKGAYRALSDEGKASWLRSIVNKEAEFASEAADFFIPGIRVQFEKLRDNESARTAFYPRNPDHMQDGIFLNSKNPYVASCPFDAVIAATHEQWHHVNNALKRGVASGALKEDHPLYYDGLYLKSQSDRNAIYTVGDLYAFQYDERRTMKLTHDLQDFFAANFPDLYSLPNYRKVAEPTHVVDPELVH